MFVVFTSILISSFISQPKYLELPVSPSLDATLNELNYSGGTIQAQSSGNFEYVLSSHENFSITETSESSAIDVSHPWKYLSSLRDVRKSYTLTGSGFSILQEGVGEVFIDSISYPGRVLILPLSTALTISLTSEDNSEVYTDIFLAPHMYLEFQPSRASFLKNADAVRIQTVYELWYLWTDISNISEHEFLKKYAAEEESFIAVSMRHIQTRDRKNNLKFKEILTQDIGKMPWYDTVERYASLFVNEEKKKIFYKNLVLEWLFWILQTQYYDEQWVAQVRKDLEVLRAIDSKSYKELVELKETLMSIVSSSSDRDLVGAKIALASLSEWYEIHSKTYFSLYGFAVFAGYDINGEFSQFLWRKFLQSFQDFVTFYNTQEKQTNFYYQYFSYFLERQLIFFLEEYTWTDSIASIIDTLKNHIEIFWPSYDADTTSRITWLYVYSEILKKVDIFLRTRYFLMERNTNKLLILHKENRLAAKDVVSFRTQIETIFKIYDNNDKFLDDENSRDRSIRKDITFTKARITEYFAALENYWAYTSEYDVSKQTLLNIDIFSQWDEEVLSKEKIQKYFEKFDGVILSGASIQVIDEYYYRLEDVFIGGKSFSFDIYPYASMKLQNIRIDAKDSRFVYKLDLIESEWEEKHKTGNPEEKEKYDFSLFFFIKFFAEDKKVIEEYVVGDTKVNEDKTEIVFKRDSLLWNKWEFSVVRDTLLLEYEDIRVVRNNLSYDIFLENTDFQTIVWEGSGKRYTGYFDSEYILDKHYFADASIAPYEKNTQADEKLLFWDTKIRINGKIPLQDFSASMKNMFTYMSTYIWIYNDIRPLYPTEAIQIQYNVYNKKMTFKFDSGWKTYTILVSEGKLEKVYKGTYKVLSKPTVASEIQKYIK